MLIFFIQTFFYFQAV